MLIDTLESRRLMSVSLDPVSKVLTITGKDSSTSPDNIAVTMEAGKVKVSDNGVISQFDSAKVGKIKVFARKGADTVDIKETVTKDTEIDTGLGGAIYTEGDKVFGGAGNDIVHVKSDYSKINTRGGNDRALVFNSHSAIDMGSGSDSVLNRGGDQNTIIAGDGVDTVDYSNRSQGMVIRNGKSGSYYLTNSVPEGFKLDGSGWADNLSGFENFNGTQGNDLMFGTSARNVMRGNGGSDRLDGFAGDDELYGDKGSDFLYGGSGKNALHGGDDNDYLYAKNGTADFLSGGLGYDRAEKDAIDTLTGVESLIIVAG